MARIIVASYLVRYPVGGYQSWMLQWLVGFHRLGHEVYFVEKAGWPNSCFNPATGESSDDASLGLQSLSSLLAAHELSSRWCFVDQSGAYNGMSQQEIESVFQTADLFIDHMRSCEWAEETARTKVRIVVDGEPGFFQMQMEERRARAVTEFAYDYHFTVGLNVGTSVSSVPTVGLSWKHLFDPIVPELFPYVAPPANAPWTTVMSWQAHKPIEFKGIVYGQKDVEFQKFMDLPMMVDDEIEVAVAGRDTPKDKLIASGWRLREAYSVTRSFDDWREYITASRGEFSVAKNVFVRTNSGFFSDRSAAYLASGRPVIMQDTGFSKHLPCGEGLFAVNTASEAADAMQTVKSDYAHHSLMARRVAEEYLDARVVLARLLKEVGL